MRITTCLNVTGRLCAAFLCLMFLFASPPAVAADRASDEFLTGYIASILERDMHWERDSYILKIVNGVAKITLFNPKNAVENLLRLEVSLTGGVAEKDLDIEIF